MRDGVREVVEVEMELDPSRGYLKPKHQAY
jgi:hypothetical protein